MMEDGGLSSVDGQQGEDATLAPWSVESLASRNGPGLAERRGRAVVEGWKLDETALGTFEQSPSVLMRRRDCCGA